MRRAVESGKLELARSTFAKVAADLAAHISIEERILFPLYEARAWREARATSVMRHEHRRILDIVETIREALASEDVGRFRDGWARLETILPNHHFKEEHVLYAAIDSVLTEAERDEVVRQLAHRNPNSLDEER